MSVTDSVAAVQYKVTESGDDQMERQKEIETPDCNEMDTDWRDNVRIGVQLAENRKNTLDMFAEFQEMWNGRLGLH